MLTDHGVWVLSLFLGELDGRRPLSSGTLFRYPTLEEAGLGRPGDWAGGDKGAPIVPIDVCLTRHHSLVLTKGGIVAVSVLSKPDQVVVHGSLALPALRDAVAFDAAGTGAGSIDSLSGPEPVLVTAGGSIYELVLVDGGRYDWKLLLESALETVQRH